MQRVVAFALDGGSEPVEIAGVVTRRSGRRGGGGAAGAGGAVAATAGVGRGAAAGLDGAGWGGSWAEPSCAEAL